MHHTLPCPDLSRVLESEDKEFADYCSLIGLFLGPLSTTCRSHALRDLLSKAATLPLDLRCQVFDTLIHFVEEMSGADQLHFVRHYAELANCSCGRHHCKGTLGVRAVLARAHRLVEKDAQAFIHLFVRTYQPARDEQRRFDALLESMNTPSSGSQSTSARLASNRPHIAMITPEFLSADTFLQPPIGMLLAAAQLRKGGYEITFIDNRVERLHLDELAERVTAADFIVINTTPYDHIQNYFLDYRLKYAFTTINALKRACPDAVVIVCGAHGTVRPDIVFREAQADVIVKGEFDSALRPVVDALACGNSLDGNPEVCLRRQASMINANEKTGAVEPHRLIQLGPRFEANTFDDDGTLPAYDLIDFGNYYGDHYVQNRPERQYRWGLMLATRGCAFDCSFCYNFWGRRVRYRNAESVVDELELLQTSFGVEHVFFADFHFTQSEAWVERFCERMRERQLKVRWSAQIRCDAAPRNLLGHMAAANCDTLWFGVESLETSMVRSMGKYGDRAAAVTAIDNCRQAGIAPHMFIMIGMPGETRASINKTIAGMHNVKAAYCGVMIATPRFGTPYYEEAKAQYPALGHDFYGLRSVRGLVGNDLTPSDLNDAMSIFGQREFIFRDTVPQLSLKE